MIIASSMLDAPWRQYARGACLPSRFAHAIKSPMNTRVVIASAVSASACAAVGLALAQANAPAKPAAEAKVPVVRAAAEALPFSDCTFDVALALMTVHHWKDLHRGLAELRRVSRRQVIFTFDPAMHDSLWVFTDYVPASMGFAKDAPIEIVLDALETDRVEIVPTPADCTDGFASAYWRRPEQYLSPIARGNISAFARLDRSQVEPGMDQLARDLASGIWQERYADLLAKETLDCGLRLVIGGAG